MGLIAAMFFTATFLINRSISIDGGHWFWSASLRFIFTVIMMGDLSTLYRTQNI